MGNSCIRKDIINSQIEPKQSQGINSKGGKENVKIAG